MIDKIWASLLIVLPFGGMAFALFRYVLKQLLTKKNEKEKKSLPITLLIKIVFSLLAGIFGAVASISFFCTFWLPGIKLPQPIGIIMLGALAIFGLSYPILIGWTKAIEAGAGSIKETSNQLKAEAKTRLQNDKAPAGQWQRRSEDEIAQIEKQLKKSAYSPVMPIGVFIVVFAALYVFLRDISNGAVLTTISALFFLCSTYLIQIAKGRSLVNKQKHKICNKCLREDDIGLTVCFCGGIYEPQEYYKPSTKV
jgi:Flp pilus assembly protein TadB